MAALKDILQTPGQHVWAFTRESTAIDVGSATRRVHAMLAAKKYAHVKVEGTQGMVMLNPKPPYKSEPVLLINVRHLSRARVKPGTVGRPAKKGTA